MRRGVSLFLMLLLPSLAVAQEGVKSVTMKFEPAEAKPGQTVKLHLIVELMDGYYTYPLKQVDANADAMVNKILFPSTGDAIFVGDAIDPSNPDVKSEPDLMIKELRTYKGKVTYSRNLVVSPKASAGDLDVKLRSFKLSVCDAMNCFPPKTLTPTAKLKVLPGPAVEVQKEYQDAVKKALESK